MHFFLLEYFGIGSFNATRSARPSWLRSSTTKSCVKSFISNNSSGKQGHAIADALRRHGADTKLISGPVNIKDPENVKVTKVSSAEEMLHECRESLPVDIAVFAAAVSDWKCSKTSNIKIYQQYFI